MKQPIAIICTWLLLLLLPFFSWGNEKVTEKRVALVIGIGNYASFPLANTINDARDVAEKLQRLDFDTELLLDEDHATIQQAIETFASKLTSADVALFYYAGHGLQFDGVNYLVPVSAQLTDVDAVASEAISTFDILGRMENAGSGTNIMILDACRNNPYEKTLIDKQGLAPMKAFGGSFIAYSTAPGSVAADGSGENGVYTNHLLKYVDQPGVQIEKLFKLVRRQVIDETAGAQVPWENSSLLGDFLFSMPATPLASGAAVKQQGADDFTYWQTVLANPDAQMFQAYLEKFPQGEFNDIAHQRLLELGQAQLVLESNLFGDVIHVNGAYRGSSRLQLSLPPGEHAIRVSKKGFTTIEEKATLQAGKITQLDVTLDFQMAEADGDVSESRSLAMSEKPAASLDPIPRLYAEYVDSVASEAVPVYPRDPALQESVMFKAKPESARLEPFSGMRFIRVEPGCFPMGSPVLEEGRQNDENLHKVCLGKGFWISQFETTQQQWHQLIDNNPSQFSACGSHCPVERVSWNDVQVYIDKFNQQTGLSARLPTEAEWEYAARAGTLTSTYAGDALAEGENNVPMLDAIAWYSGNSAVDYKGGKYCEDWNEKQYYRARRCGTRPVGLKQPNSWQLFDMIGNVWEWTSDSYRPHSTREQSDPQFNNAERLKVVKGGNWADALHQNRAAARYAFNRDERLSNVGFRIVIED